MVYTTEEGVAKYANEIKLVGLGECHVVGVETYRGVMNIEDLKKKMGADKKVCAPPKYA